MPRVVVIGDVGAHLDHAGLTVGAWRELHESWMEYHNRGGLVPFSQIHGHSAIVSYAEQTWHTPGRVRQRSTVDWEARQFRVRVGGRIFTGVDPKHGRQGAPTWRPLVLPNAAVLTAGSPLGGQAAW